MIVDLKVLTKRQRCIDVTTNCNFDNVVPFIYMTVSVYSHKTKTLAFFSSAAVFNHGQIVELLLENGADIEAKDQLAMTPLLMAVTLGATHGAKVLLDHGADITAVDSSLNSCLHLAVTCRKPEMVKLLLERDRDKVVLFKDKDLKTVFHLAAGLEDSKVLAL